MGGNYPGWNSTPAGAATMTPSLAMTASSRSGPWYHIVGIYKVARIEIYINNKPGVSVQRRKR